MIRYERSGLNELLRAIEQLEVEDEGDRVDVRDDEIVVSFKAVGNWIVYVGKLDKRALARYWNHRYFKRVEEAVANMGCGIYNITWVGYSYIFTRTCTAIAGEWLLKKLNVPYSSYHPLMWNRELAIEYTKCRRDGL